MPLNAASICLIVFHQQDWLDTELPLRAKDNSRLKSCFAQDFGPLEENCQCYACANHSRAYLHHLVREQEMTSGTLLSIHNLTFLIGIAQQCRQAIIEGTFRQLFEKYAQQRQEQVKESISMTEMALSD